tara:strand:- start:3125 stop:3796 length:672 start_codon:yes stop_codon:yes gene_type:complete
MKKIAIMQPYFFPYLGYWQLIHSVDKFVILDDVNFIKKGWIHRNTINLNDKHHQINLCIEKASQNKLIKELYLSADHNWKKKVLNKISAAYSKKCARFNNVNGLVSDIIYNKETNLSKYLLYSIKSICSFLKLSVEFVDSSSVYPKNGLKGQERIIDICKREGVSTYVNPMGGRELYSKEQFNKNNIELKFINTRPSLSVVDHMMNHSKEETLEKIKEYKLND